MLLNDGQSTLAPVLQYLDLNIALYSQIGRIHTWSDTSYSTANIWIGRSMSKCKYDDSAAISQCLIPFCDLSSASGYYAFVFHFWCNHTHSSSATICFCGCSWSCYLWVRKQPIKRSSMLYHNQNFIIFFVKVEEIKITYSTLTTHFNALITCTITIAALFSN